MDTNMLALSTSWQSDPAVTAEALLVAVKSVGIEAIELSYRISEDQYRQIKAPLRRSGLKVVSVHNYFPIPASTAHARGSGDLFLLSSPRQEERRNAIRFTATTIEHAGELGAAAVVLHCGFVEMNPELQALYHYYHSNQLDSEEAQIFVRHKLKERNRRKPVYLDCLMASLERLIPVAEKQGVLLGLENRYHYHELPGLDDFKVIFDTFQGAPIGDWHDTGHAHANETLNLIPQNSLLQTCADRLIGIHLHDAVGLDDHIPPGSGEIDFVTLKVFLKSDTIKVLELKPGIPVSEVAEGIRFIREMQLGG